MKKIVFAITSLNIGGAERVLVDICNNLKDKYDITIFSLYGNGNFEKQLDHKIKFISMYDKKYDELSKLTKFKMSIYMLNNHLRKKIYNKYLTNYDVTISFLEGPVTWILENSTSKNIAWIHNDIEKVFNGKFASLKKKMNDKSYSKYDKLIFVSNDNLNKFKEVFPNNKVPKEVIYNYLDTKLVIDKSNEYIPNDIDEDVPSFIQVSRLVSQKGIDRLIDVHKKLIDDGYKHNIYVIGDGPLRDKLENKIKELNLYSFKLLGSKENPYPYIKKGKYFMLTSLYEGFPMVLLEAKALNKYILITDTAARETLLDYKDSLIVDNSFEGIYEGIKDLILKKDTNITSKYNSNNILKQITNIIEGD